MSLEEVVQQWCAGERYPSLLEWAALREVLGHEEFLDLFGDLPAVLPEQGQ